MPPMSQIKPMQNLVNFEQFEISQISAQSCTKMSIFHEILQQGGKIKHDLLWNKLS